MYAVDYNDQDNKTRWGYLTKEGFELFDKYRQDNIGDPSTVINVYLGDGTIGRAKMEHLNPINLNAE